MERLHLHTFYSLIFAVVFSLSVIAFVLCVVAEFKKSKIEDVKLDDKLCELPGSEAFGLGVAALICLSIAQIIGNLIIFMGLWFGSRSCYQAKRPTIASTLVVISWLSYGMAVIIISTATSMNRRQAYGKGWLDGECFVVKDGVFIGGAILVLLTLGCTLASGATIMRQKFQVTADEKAKLSVCTSGMIK